MQIEKKSYIVNNQIWLNKLYFQISNSKDKQCLTIDTREANELGPGKFRTHTDNNEEQTCFFNRKNDTHIFSFLAKRVPNEQIIFKTNIGFERNKSLEISLENSVLKNESCGDIQSASRENFRRRYFDNARRPETSGFTPERNLLSQSADARGRRDDRDSRRESNYSGDRSASTRKKPKFI